MAGLILGWDRPLSPRGIGFSSGTAVAADSSAPTLITDTGEGHLMVVGRTGSGKGRSVIMPIALDYPGSIVLIDIKGEAAAVTARRRREMGQDVVILEPFGRNRNAASFNPMQRAGDDPDYVADAAMTMAEMLKTPGPTQDIFWPEMAGQLNSALIAYHAGHPDERERNLGAVWRSLMKDDFPYYLASVLDDEKSNLHPFVYQQFASFLQADTRNVQTSIRTTAQLHMRVFGAKQVDRATSRTSFSIDALKDGKPMSIYIVIPPNRLETYAPLLRLWLSALLSHLTERTTRPAIPTLFLIDELANIGPMPQVKQAVTLLRGYGVRCALFLQSISQLKGMWPLDYETIIENCELLSVFGMPNLGAARQMEAVMGDISAEALLGLAPTDLALSRAGKPTRIVGRLDYLNDPMFAGHFDSNPMYVQR